MEGYMKAFLMNIKKNENDIKLFRLIVAMLTIFIVLVIVLPDKFLTLNNLKSMAFQFPEIGIYALAMMLAMMSGGIDLSIVGIGNLSSIVAVFTMTRVLNPETTSLNIYLIMIIAVIIGLLTGVLCGVLNGILITKIGIIPILTTLGTMQIFTGLATGLTKGSAVFGLPEQYAVIGNGYIWIFPIPLVIFTFMALLVTFVLKTQALGFNLKLYGTNAKAANFSGIRNDLVVIKTYALGGFLAAVSGLTIVGRTVSAKADYGNSYTLMALLIVILGGVLPEGGFGKVKGVFFAVITLQIISSGYNLLRFDQYFKNFSFGLLVVVLMIMNYRLSRK